MLKTVPFTLNTTVPFTSVTAKSPSDRLMAFFVTVRSTGYGAQNCGPTTATGLTNGAALGIAAMILTVTSTAEGGLEPRDLVRKAGELL